MMTNDSAVLIPSQQVQKDWEDLQRWVKVKQLRVVVLIEGDDQMTAKKWIKKLQEWSIYENMIQAVSMEEVIIENETSYFRPLISKLPFKEQIAFFDNCWYGKAIEKSNLGKWGLDLWAEFADKEMILRQAGFIVVKYGLHDTNQPEAVDAVINGIIKRTEVETHPFNHFNCEQKEEELHELTKHLIQQVLLEDACSPSLNN